MLEGIRTSSVQVYEGRARYRYVNQSSFDNKARSKPLPVRLIRARFEPGIWRRCSSGFVGIGSVGDGDSSSELAFSHRRLRVPIWCSVLCLVLVLFLFRCFWCFDILGTEINDGVDL